jgi:hypothetical protein
MKSPIGVAFAVAVALVVPLVTGCAEEEAEGGEVAYPVGATVPPAEPPPVAGAPGQELPPAPVSGSSEPGSEEVVVGADDEAPQDDQTADADPSALTDFRPALDPYGTWVDDSTYGTVWVPSPSAVGADFAPYKSAGHWAYDDDYVWVSDYDWGWAPFHYGRWVYGGGAGWEWIPGRRYAGAWVSWRYGVGDWGYVGWAPLSPTWGWRRGIAVGIGFVPAAPYGFVATRDLFAPRLGSRFVSGEGVGLIAGHTRPWVPVGATAIGGRVLARPGVGGPPLAELRIPHSAAVRAGINGSVMQARAFSRSGPPASIGVASPREPMGGGRWSAPAYGPPAPSHFGGRFGAGFTGSGVASGPVRGAYEASARPYFGTPSSAATPSYRVLSPSSGYRSAPSFRSFSGGSPAGSMRGSAGYSGGGHVGGGAFHGGGGGGFHGGGGGSRGGGRGGGHR